jgi:type III restriction enzyme
MELKKYQKRVVEEIERFLTKLAAERAAGNARHAAADAWSDLRLPCEYKERKNGLGEDLPTLRIKVPTGGGKTILATQVLGSIHRILLPDRRGTGLVLWVVPSNQIYRDTLRRLRDRNDSYRLMLEHALSHRLEIWEKHEIARLTPARLSECLNILVVQLASTNRESREQLKFFKDSGGNIVQHFPAEDDIEAHRKLKREMPNLEVIEGTDMLKTSVGNFVRLCGPAVILDEGHKATSPLARETIEGFNATIVIELSATPPDKSNIVSRVNGQQLLDEHMIKLPLNVASSAQRDWKAALTQARDKRQQLARLAERAVAGTGPERWIRPIVLVQAERTGKEQRGAKIDGRLAIHSDDVKEYLISQGIAESAIAIKTSEKDELIEHTDLIDPECPIEWIITKSALQEGWDCPFAYVLVSLNNTGSGKSMTQLVGRILRQPHQERTDFDELNESYIYCLHKKAGEIAREVKKALEDEGYEGDAASVVDRSVEGEPAEVMRESRIQKKFRRHYREFEGKIYLPRFCVRNSSSDYEQLDYFRHLLSRVDVGRFDYAGIDWDLEAELASARDRFYRITLQQDDPERVAEREAEILETDEQVARWLTVNLPFDWFSQKQLRLVVEQSLDRLFRVNRGLAGKLALVKFPVRDRLAGFVQDHTDRQTEAAFQALFASKNLCFFLECMECRFPIPEPIQVRAMRQLARENGDLVQKSLFDQTPEDSFNEFEKSIALCIDEHPEVLWWYRNLVGPENFSIQGYRRNLIYPDFVVQQGRAGKPAPSVIVVESKGSHLTGNPDTEYKRNVAKYFERAGHRVPWQKLGEEFENHTFRFQILDEGEYSDQEWRGELKRLLDNGSQ